MSYKLLVIDDEQAILDVIKNYFEKRDFIVSTALDGEQGLIKLRTEAFDVALIDLCLLNSTISGIDIIKAIDTESITVNSAVITGHGERNEAVLALNLGVQAWFDKPLNMETLYKEVKKLAQVIPEEKFDEFMAVLNEKR
jgi:two-component system alkaline phosphatase synthesis response regulator PhoP